MGSPLQQSKEDDNLIDRRGKRNEYLLVVEDLVWRGGTLKFICVGQSMELDKNLKKKW